MLVNRTTDVVQGQSWEPRDQDEVAREPQNLTSFCLTLEQSDEVNSSHAKYSSFSTIYHQRQTCSEQTSSSVSPRSLSSFCSSTLSSVSQSRARRKLISSTIFCCSLYAIVQYDFDAERPDELQAKAGEPIIVIAQSNHEW